jgi:hypothetical protein
MNTLIMLLLVYFVTLGGEWMVFSFVCFILMGLFADWAGA